MKFKYALAHLTYALSLRPIDNRMKRERRGISDGPPLLAGGSVMIAALMELVERFVFDPSVIDLVVWFPHLSWNEFLLSVVTVAAWRFTAAAYSSHSR